MEVKILLTIHISIYLSIMKKQVLIFSSISATSFPLYGAKYNIETVRIVNIFQEYFM